MLITAAFMLSLAVVYLLARSYSAPHSQLMEPRSTTLVLGVQIICGDCASDDGPPIKTYVDRFGNCERCGGHSYMLAANCSRNVQEQAGLRSYQRALKDLYI